MLKNVQPGQKAIVLRYGKQIVDNCIELHQDEIKKCGFCWFGKLGTVPSKKSIDAILEEEKPIIVLYSRNNAYICDLEDISYDIPEKGYPSYYQKELFDNYMYPSIYFKLSSIKQIDVNYLEQFTVISSGNTAISTLMHSMSSFLFVSYGKSRISVEKVKEPQKVVKKQKLTENDCVYRKEGRCGLRGFVNYQYECDRPANCIRQKR